MNVAPLMIGTAGHVDHGKTSLLARLTDGAPEADRLPEERERGLTIDIGYAQLGLDGRTVGVMDVPGHERFIRNMVAAASGIDLILLVVAADDGVMPQTREHLEIASLLGATTGLVALTKIDLVDEDLLLLAEEDVRELVAGTFLADAPILRVSSVTGEGVEDLRRALTERLRDARPKAPEGVFRLPVQRSFLLPGHGTVVTGVPLSGRVKVGDTLELLPGARRARVRALQAYHEEVPEACAGHRVALKLSDVSFKQVRRGDVVAEPGYLEAANLIEARLRLLPRRAKPLTSNRPVRFHTGTAEVVGRVFLLEGRELAPGEEGLVQFRLDRPVAVAPGDRFVLRTPSPQVTLGGGRVIGPSSRRITMNRTRLVRRVREREASLAKLPAALAFQVAASGLVPLSRRDLAAAVVRRHDEISPIVDRLLEEGKLVAVGERLLCAEEIGRGRKKLHSVLDGFHGREPLRSAANRAWARGQIKVEDAVLDALVAGDPEVEVVEGGKIRRAGFEPALSPEQRERLESIERILDEAEFETPRENEIPDLVGANPEEARKLTELLLEEGSVVRLGDGVLLHRRSLDRAMAVISERIREHGPIGPADLKEELGLTRKYSIPLLEWLDSVRFTVRQGDRRILGTRSREEV